MKTFIFEEGHLKLILRSCLSEPGGVELLAGMITHEKSTLASWFGDVMTSALDRYKAVSTLPLSQERYESICRQCLFDMKHIDHIGDHLYHVQVEQLYSRDPMHVRYTLPFLLDDMVGDLIDYYKNNKTQHAARVDNESVVLQSIHLVNLVIDTIEQIEARVFSDFRDRESCYVAFGVRGTSLIIAVK